MEAADRRVVSAGKLTEVFPSCSVVSACSFFSGREASKKEVATTNLDVRIEEWPTRPPVNTLPALATPNLPVHVALSLRCQTKVRARVVEGVSVCVVDQEVVRRIQYQAMHLNRGLQARTVTNATSDGVDGTVRAALCLPLPLRQPGEVGVVDDALVSACEFDDGHSDPHHRAASRDFETGLAMLKAAARLGALSDGADAFGRVAAKYRARGTALMQRGMALTAEDTASAPCERRGLPHGLGE